MPAKDFRPCSRLLDACHRHGVSTNGDLRVRTGQSRRPADHARRMIDAVIRDIRESVLFSAVRLTGHRAPVVAQANLELTGRTLSVRAEAPTPTEAIDLLAERLDGALHDLRPQRFGSMCAAN